MASYSIDAAAVLAECHKIFSGDLKVEDLRMGNAEAHQAYTASFATRVLPPHIHPLRLHSSIVIQANMRSDNQSLYCALHSILKLLTPTIPIFDFMETVKWIMDTSEDHSCDIPILLTKVMAMFTAYMKQEWGSTTDAILYAEFFDISDFKQFLFNAQDELSLFGSSWGILTRPM